MPATGLSGEVLAQTQASLPEEDEEGPQVLVKPVEPHVEGVEHVEGGIYLSTQVDRRQVWVSMH